MPYRDLLLQARVMQCKLFTKVSTLLEREEADNAFNANKVLPLHAAGSFVAASLSSRK